MFISPMLLHKSDEPFDDSGYLTELKLDGIRLIYSVGPDGKVRLYTRHKNEVTARFPELHGADLPPDTILDGELIVSDSEGKPDFEAMMSRFMSRRDATPVHFVAFDILRYKGEDVRKQPLMVRKAFLADALPEDTDAISKVRYIEGNGPAYYDAIKSQALEGIVLKRKDSHYETGKRSHSWLKVVNYRYDDVFIVGYRKKEFGLALTFGDGRYAGVMELGVPPEVRHQMYRTPTVKESKGFAYFDKPIAVRVKCRNLTKSGLLRLPSFVEFA